MPTHTISSRRPALQKKIGKTTGNPNNEGRFTRRILGLERFIPKAYLRETYLVIRTWMNEKTRTCWPGVEEIAERAGVDPSTIRRHLRQLEKLGVIETTYRKKSCRSNLTSVYFFPLLNEDFVRQKLRGGGAQNARVIQIPETKVQTTTAREARGEWKPDRETYQQHPVADRPGRRMTHLEAWRLKCDAERARMASQAAIGMYTGPKSEMTEAEVERIRAKEREARERYRRICGGGR